MKPVVGDDYAGFCRRKLRRCLISDCSILALCLFPFTGCGTTVTVASAPIERSVSISASVATLLPQTTAALTVTPRDIPASTVTLQLSCNSSQCGSLYGHVFTAPQLATPDPLNVTVTASSTVPATQHSTFQFTIVPPATITSISPRSAVSGSTQQMTITGFGFNSSSIVEANSELDKNPVQVTNIHVDSPTAITFSLSLPLSESGMVSIQVYNTAPASSSSPVDLYVTPSSAKGDGGLPIFNVSAYAASGSPQTFHCSGKAGGYRLTCDDAAIDFLPNQGIRIVGAGANEQNPSVKQQPQLDKIGVSTSGIHSYCYVVYATDVLGGISTPSPQTCISGEPSLSYSGTYNNLAPPYKLPLSAFIWYVSEDSGPFQLFSVGLDAADDVGQRIGTRNGWPSSYPAGSSGISKNEDLFTTVVSINGNEITLAQPLVSSVDEAEVDHDDTGAIQSAINAAVSAGGGVIKIGDGTFNVRRPSFQYYTFNGETYPSFTTTYSLKPSWIGYTNLYIPNGATGNVFIKGNGASTILQTPPDFGGFGKLIAIGDYSNPAYPPYPAIKIDDVGKGGTSLVLSDVSQIGVLHAGDDIWLYSGAFDPNPKDAPCVDSGGSAGGNCHFSELNSILRIEGRVITLKYPTSKKIYDDGRDSFGLVKLPVTPHNVGIENLTINTSNPITGSGLVYGLLINHVTINGFLNHGAFGGGFKRDVLIENSSWGLGLGDVSWYGTEEYDQFTNVEFINDAVTGHAAPRSEGPSQCARLYFTEGTSQVVIEGSTFDHVSILFEDTTDNIVDGNEFNDAHVSIGGSFDPFNHPLLQGPLNDAAFLSFGSQQASEVNNNVFNIDSTFYPPWIINLRHFVKGQIDGNTIVDNSPGSLAVINSAGGKIKGNMITLGTRAISSWVIAAIPDEGPGVPASSFDIEGNIINAGSALAGIYVVDSGFTNTAPMCIAGNTINIQNGPKISVSSSTINQTCAASAP